MEKLKIEQQSLGRLTTTSINLDIDTYLKIEKASILTGKRKSEILAEMVNFALKYTEINGSKMSCDFGLRVKKNEVTKDEPKQDNETPVSAPTTQYISIRKAAALTGIGEKAIRNFVKSGKIPSIKIGTHNRINVQTLQEVLKNWEDLS